MQITIRLTLLGINMENKLRIKEGREAVNRMIVYENSGIGWDVASGFGSVKKGVEMYSSIGAEWYCL